MRLIRLAIGNDVFEGVLQDDLAPKTCARFTQMLPWTERLIHVRWSGEACWVPLGNLHLGLEPENPTGRPNPGELLLYEGPPSETELLLAYGCVRFSSKEGPLLGNPLLRITEGLDRLSCLGRDILAGGSREIRVGM